VIRQQIRSRNGVTWALVVGLLAGHAARAETITWTGGAGDSSWHSPGNWDLARVPAAGDDVMISLNTGVGFDVTLNGDAQVQSLVLGNGADDIQLNTAGRTLTLTGPGTSRITTGGYLAADGTTLVLNAAFEVAGSLECRRTTNISNTGPFQILTGGNLYAFAVDGGGCALTFTNGFVSNGTIHVRNYGGDDAPDFLDITIGAGALINAAGGVVRLDTGTDRAAERPRLFLELVNHGLFEVLGSLRPEVPELRGSGANHHNTGTIRVDDRDLLITGSNGLTNAGSIEVSPGRTLSMNGGTYQHDAPIAFDGAALKFAQCLVYLNASMDVPAGASLTLLGASALNGGLAPIQNSGTLSMINSANSIQPDIVNNGTIEIDGAATIFGFLLNQVGGVVHLYGSTGGCHGSTANAVGGLTNEGLLRLDLCSTNTIRLTVAGTLMNAASGQIVATSTNSPAQAQINGSLDNQGTIDVLGPTDLFLLGASAVRSNSGTINLSGGGLVIGDSSWSFVNTGSVTVSPGRTLRMVGGTYQHDAPIAFDGAALTFENCIVNLNASLDVPAGAALTLVSGSALNGSAATIQNSGTVSLISGGNSIEPDIVNDGTIEIDSGGALTTFYGSLANQVGGVVQLHGFYGGCHPSVAQVLGGIQNEGVVRLDLCSTNTIRLTVAGTLVNAASGQILTTSTNSPAQAHINGSLDNQGTIDVLGPTDLFLLGAGAVRSNSGTINLSGGGLVIGDAGWSLVNSGQIAIPATRTLTAHNEAISQTSGSIEVAGDLVANGGLNLSGGVLKGTGTVTGPVNNSAGTVACGSSPGVLTISGSYTQGPGGTLDVEVGGYNAGTEFDRLLVSGAATLDGTLRPTLINGFAPLATDSFQILSAGSVAGTFAAVVPCDDAVTYTSTSASLMFDRQGPAIDDEPDDQTVSPGDTAMFSLVASGGGTLVYQWRKDGLDLADGPSGSGSTISGASTAALTISNAQPDDEGSYDCVIADACGTSGSAAAALTVQGDPCIDWAQVAAGGPSARVGHAMAYDSGRDVSVLFGGWDGTHAGETWEWDGGTWTLRAGTGPSPRSWAAMAYDSARGVAVLFGGYEGYPYYSNGETWEWDGNNWTLRASTGPFRRYGHAMAYDSARAVTVLFGGPSFGGNETWEWDGNAWTLRATTGPSPRIYHAMAYDSARGVTVLFGGYPFIDETWEWDGNTWTLRPNSGPAGRSYPGMAYDSARGVSVLFGGFTQHPSPYNGETWEWDGDTWSQAFLEGPGGRYGHAMIYDTARSSCMIFGGTSNVSPGRSDDTWELGPNGAEVQITDPPDALTVAFGNQASFSVVATGSGVLNHQWRRDGVNLADGETAAGSTVSGATTATLVIDGAQFADEGAYDCVVSNACGAIDSDDAVLDVNPVSGPRLHLTRIPTDDCVGPGETLTVQLRMSDLGGQAAFGYQAFLSFDPARLAYVDGVYTAAPFGLHVVDPIAVSGGEIDLAATIDVAGGQSASSSDALLATLTFNVLSAAGPSSITFRAHEPPSRIVGGEEEITATLEDLPQFSVDTAPPVLTLPADATVECTDPDDPAFTGTATAVDDADANPLVTFSDSEAAGACPQALTITRRWRAEDCAGNVAEADQVIHVQDSTPPTITTAATPQTVECDGAGNAAALSAWLSASGGAAAEDNCGAVTWSHDFSALSDDCGETGAATVTFTATDECGNASSTTATFTVADTTPPTFSASPTMLTLECADPGNDAAIAAWLASAAAEDACGAAGVADDYTALTPGACPGIGAATVTWTATDLCGLTTDHVAVVQVVDTTPPVFTAASGGELPVIHTIADAGQCTATVVVDTPAVFDACDPAVSVTGVRSDELDLADPYPSSAMTTITWTATDCSSNSTVVTQTVSVDAVNEIDVDVQLASGGGAATIVRCIRFEVFPDNCDTPIVVDQDVTFTSGLATGVVIQVPCGSYSCVTARDAKHTLRRTDDDDFGTMPVVGLRYRADFTDRRGAGGDDDALIQGNLHQDNNEYRYIDILDFAVLLTRYGQAAPVDTPCGFVGRHADLTGDGAVGLPDLAVLLSVFGRTQEPNCCGLNTLTGGGNGVGVAWGGDDVEVPGAGQGAAPRESITVAELLALGLGELVAADLNGDGVVDLTDVDVLTGGNGADFDEARIDAGERSKNELEP